MRVFSLKRRILFIVLGLTVLSQCIYLYVNVRSFHESYHQVVRSNLISIGTSLQGNLERILNMGISIQKLVGLDSLLKGILKDSEELHAIALRDFSGQWLYYCDRRQFLQGPAIEDHERARTIRFYEGKDRVLLPLYGSDHAKKGELHLQLDVDLMNQRVREIALDSGTVILISVLAVIDFVFFIVAFTVTLPVQRAAGGVQEAQKRGAMDLPIQRTGIDFLDQLLNRFDRYRTRLMEDWIKLNTLLQSLIQSRGPETEDGGKYKSSLLDLEANIHRLTFAEHRVPEPSRPFSPVLIRPAVFIFVFAEALSISFLPVFAKSLYQPILHLSQEVVIGLPISAFMLCIAIALPIGGTWSDLFGKKKVFLTGTVISGIGLFLTGTAQDIFTLILYRAMVGFGFGLVFMASQNYIIEATTIANRAEGLAMFISAFYGGTLCGSAIGGMLADRIGFRMIFFLGGVFAVASIFFLYLFVTERRDTGTNETWKSESREQTPGLIKGLPSAKDFFRLFSNRDFAALVMLQSIPNKICLIGFVYYLAPLFLQELGNNRSETGRYVMGYSLMMILFSQIFSRWSDRRHKMKAGIFWGGTLSGLVLIPFFFFGNTLMVALGIVLLGLSHALSVSNQTKLASQLYAVRRVGLGAGLGIYRLAERVGNVIAPILAGFLLSVAGYSKSLAIIGIYTLVSSLLYLVLAQKRVHLRIRLSSADAVTCRVDGGDVELIDLGAGGLSFSNIGLTPGHVGSVSLDLPEYGESLSARIEVVRIDHRDICHCRFKTLPMDVGEAIHAYILARTAEDSP